MLVTCKMHSGDRRPATLGRRGAPLVCALALVAFLDMRPAAHAQSLELAPPNQMEQPDPEDTELPEFVNEANQAAPVETLPTAGGPKLALAETLNRPGDVTF